MLHGNLNHVSVSLCDERREKGIDEILPFEYAMIFNPFRGAHLDDERLSCFIDGTCGESDRIRIIKHLKSCRRCSESYREAVMYKGLWISGEADLAASEESIETAQQAFDRIKTQGASKIYIKPSPSKLLSRKYYRLITFAASIVIIATIAISYRSVNRNEYPILDQSHIAPIREAVELASMSGHMVIPGGERLIGTVSEAYRSGYVRIDDSLRTAFTYFAGEYQEDQTSRSVVYWLLGGYIATGQVNAARDLASEAVKEFPTDIDMMIFNAIVYYMEGNVSSSERVFRQILELEPADLYAKLNLAVLLYERGEEFEALRILDHIIADYDDSPFAGRAGIIREEILGSQNIDS